jgi:hypothetical protein
MLNRIDVSSSVGWVRNKGNNSLFVVVLICVKVCGDGTLIELSQFWTLSIVLLCYLKLNTLRLHYESIRLIPSIGLIRYINIAITLLDIIHYLVLIKKRIVSETGFCLRCLQVDHTQLNQIDRANLLFGLVYLAQFSGIHLKTESSLGKVVF